MADKITTKELMSQKNDFVIIDVRELDELKNGIIEDSIHMSLGLCIRNVKKKQIENIERTKKFVLIVVLDIEAILQLMN